MYTIYTGDGGGDEKLAEYTADATSIGIGFTIFDTVKDLGDFIAGKDLITGDKISRKLLLICLISPTEAGDIGIRQGTKGASKGELHHIASDKSLISGFTAKYEKIFKNAGMNLQDDANLIFLEGHSGAHTKVYKQYILNYIINATKGLKGDAAKEALTKALTDLKDQLIKNPKMPYKGGL